jgi:hypothetical protein
MLTTDPDFIIRIPSLNVWTPYGNEAASLYREKPNIQQKGGGGLHEIHSFDFIKVFLKQRPRSLDFSIASAPANMH